MRSPVCWIAREAILADPALLSRLEDLDLFPETGRITRISSGDVVASGPDAPLSAHCSVLSAIDGAVVLRGQVVAVSKEGVRIMPFGHVGRVRIGDLVRRETHGDTVPVGDGLSGRAIDALGHALDGGPPPICDGYAASVGAVLDRISPSRPVVTGIRAIDGLLTIGQGQRVGIFAASGVGKTTLVEQIVRQVECDRIVICQIGERGREVEALWSQVRTSGMQARTSVVAATSDESATMRAQSLEQALRMAEYWRDCGKHVLLVVDSVTRYAMALREIGLAAGEPPMVRAYTPNVLRDLPRVVERCGALRGKGAITALYTVLSETDDVDDPIVEVMKSLLDGHILLSRQLAESGHFPAIDVTRSVSRLFPRLVDEDHVQAATRLRAALAKYDESRILVESGMYKPGADKALDTAITERSAIQEFLRQSPDTAQEWPSTIEQLRWLGERCA